MSQTLSVTRRVRRDADVAGAFLSDPHQVLPLITGLGRWRFVRDTADGEEWDVFLDVGAIQVGGRVLVTKSDGAGLSWQTIRGTHHAFEATLASDGDDSILTLTATYTLSGLVLAWVSELLGRGIVQRHLEAAAEEIRHHLEYELA
ncbi:hypothetical protein ACHIPZ_07180 [Antrihabitans sp. NCIMB 15449]|uniref:Polyketide cyclase / dehydrase and lipid transport n=1 Tax=Antrihabitans spumae TaxID=3373370 RepID=A0ABW7JLB5_9NOCA